MDIDFNTLDDNELLNYCKLNNISYLNKQNKPYTRKTLLSNIKNNKISIKTLKNDDILKTQQLKFNVYINNIIIYICSYKASTTQ